MKKISTAAASEIRNISNQKLTIGLDLGDRSSWYCALGESGRVVLQQAQGIPNKNPRPAMCSLRQSIGPSDHH